MLVAKYAYFPIYNCSTNHTQNGVHVVISSLFFVSYDNAIRLLSRFRFFGPVVVNEILERNIVKIAVIRY